MPVAVLPLVASLLASGKRFLWLVHQMFLDVAAVRGELGRDLAFAAAYEVSDAPVEQLKALRRGLLVTIRLAAPAVAVSCWHSRQIPALRASETGGLHSTRTTFRTLAWASVPE